MQTPAPTNLNLHDRVVLAHEVQGEGYRLIVKLMKDRALRSTEDLLNLKPDDPQREQKVNGLQVNAYAINTFVRDVLRDIEYNAALKESELATKQ